jgi:hypothetical protein
MTSYGNVCLLEMSQLCYSPSWNKLENNIPDTEIKTAIISELSEKRSAPQVEGTADHRVISARMLDDSADREPVYIIH